MKNIFILLILLFLILIHSSIGSSIILENPKHINQTEINILCKIVNDITSDSKDTQDVLIGRVGRRIEESVIDKITKCIKKDKAVVHADLNRQMKNDYNLRKVAVMVVEMKNTDKVTIFFSKILTPTSKGMTGFIQFNHLKRIPREKSLDHKISYQENKVGRRKLGKDAKYITFISLLISYNCDR